MCSVFYLLNQASKLPHTAALLMEFVWTLHAAGCFLANCHVPHELNGWADELTHSLYGGFAKDLYLDMSGIYFEQFFLLPRLASGLAIDLAHCPPIIP